MRGPFQCETLEIAVIDTRHLQANDDDQTFGGSGGDGGDDQVHQ